MSEKLYYHISNSVVDVCSVPYGGGKKRIKIICNQLINKCYNSKEVGCGCSMGVDSLSAMFRLSSDECPEDYKITILTNFNVGAYGNDLNKSHVSNFS